ncbi:MAG TPA: class I SAM-dependent methyltransferase [Gaiellaceae bacterium]|nr:class I SAM-dependent methyltransferase [Gaiellaceae bacterium]
MSAQDDPEVVRREYADDAGLAGRQSLWARRVGPAPLDIAFDALLAQRPSRVLEVGCGRGEYAERLAAAGLDVVATDQSEHMVELTRARGVEARVADVQELPFADDAFDAAVSNFMLYHVPDLERALGELARVAPTLVAITNGRRQLKEMWDLVGRDLRERERLFFCENGASYLRERYRAVEVHDASGTIEMSGEDMRHYIAHSVAHKHLVDRVPDFAGTTTVTAATCIVVASR